MRKITLFLILSLFILMLPNFSSAITVEELKTQIDNLLRQI